MKRNDPPTRRAVLKTGVGSGAALLLAGCGPAADADWLKRILGSAGWLNYRVQRLLIGANTLAQEYPESDISTQFKANGTTDPKDDGYKALAKKQFVGWALQVDGLVERPATFSLAALRALPSRTQITRHDCVEGWSCIGKWKGVPLTAILDQVGVKAQARYVVFHCADTMGEDEDDSENEDGGEQAATDRNAKDGTKAETANNQSAPDDDDDETGEENSGKTSAPKYYESIDLVDARHPQTILAYDMNDKPLKVAHGAPLRVRVERQLGYKMAKYLMRIELVASYAAIGDGNGGYWEDNGYDWYAGI